MAPDTATKLDIRFRQMLVQWNPSTVIAFQRLLGRFRKNIRGRRRQIGLRQLNLSRSDSSGSEQPLKASQKVSPSAPLRASITVERLTFRLNKKHQNRCLLHASICGGSTNFSRNDLAELSVNGDIAFLFVTDPSRPVDTGNVPHFSATPKSLCCSENQEVLSMAHDYEREHSTKLLAFTFQTYH
ncbi:MAG: hypothetical protein ACRDL7_13205, partial [Gaiellaceae bacterium]